MRRSILWLAILATACGGEGVQGEGPGSGDETQQAAQLLPSRTQPEGLDFLLFGVDEQDVRLSDFRGQPVILSFFYRSCPDANMCPMLLSKLQEVAKGVGEKAPETEVIAISFDPKNDTPENLAIFSQSKDLKFRVLTGHPDDIAVIARDKFGITYEEKAPALFDHNMKTFVIDENGELVQTFPGSRWEPSDIVRVAEKLTAGE
ncbi:MAG: SCO family protein [Planctomycetota bacterium]